MDNLTHAVLGATIAQAAFGHRLGRRAALWGAGVSVLPDVDLVAVAFAGPLAEFRYHRGLTHALWFPPVAGSLLGWAAWRWQGARPGPERRPGPGVWIGLFVLVLFTHPLLDACTTYGTQLLAPFSWRRFALDGIAIIDPAYTLVFVAALAAMAAARFRVPLTRAAGLAAVVLSSAYLGYGVRLNTRAEAAARWQLATAGVQGADVHAYPTLLQPFLRRVVARSSEEVRVGFLSLWRPEAIQWRSFTPSRGALADDLRATPEGRLFEWFAMGQATPRVRRIDGGYCVALEDLRYSFSAQPDEGLWGVRAPYSDDGRRRGPVLRFNRGPSDIGEVLVRIWRETFGPTS